MPEQRAARLLEQWRELERRIQTATTADAEILQDELASVREEYQRTVDEIAGMVSPESTPGAPIDAAS